MLFSIIIRMKTGKDSKGKAALAAILRPCLHRLPRWFRESEVRHADETTWPCNGVHGQCAWGFFARFVAPFLFRRTRGGAVPRAVLRGVADGVTVHDGYAAYDKACGDASQQCYAHILRRFGRLLEKEPGNGEYQAFVPKFLGLLSEAMKLRGLVIARKTSFGGQSEDALWVREVMQSVMESLALLYDDPAAALAEALDLYAKTGSKAAVRDFLFPKVMPEKRPGRPKTASSSLRTPNTTAPPTARAWGRARPGHWSRCREPSF